MTVADAKALLKDKGIILAAILTSGNVTDTANAFIFKQNPDVYAYGATPAYIQPGQTMDIWIQMERPVIDTLKMDSLHLIK
jgi:eukaryotic-like serine/threonine-protein kinase